MTEFELLDVAERRPENLLLASAEQLEGFAFDECNGPDLRCAVVAELVARWCLSGDAGLGKFLSGVMGESAWRAFSDWYNVERLWTDSHSLPGEHGAWRDPALFPGLEEALRRRLERLFSVHGFIPVFNSAGAWFIPFRLDAEVPGAAWSDGKPVEEWSDPVSRALSGTGMCGIRIQLRNGPELSASVTGKSLMLPVWMAAQRGRSLPRYDVLRVLATGAFDGAFQLSDVAVGPKFDAMKSQFRDAILFAPNAPGEIGQGSRGFFPLDEGMDEQALLRRIRDGLEGSAGVVSMTRDYALRRLPDMDSRVDRENHNRWCAVATQLECLKNAVDPGRDPGKWLEFSSLLATALCHAGRTDDSRACSREAMSFASAHGFAAKALRLQVTSAVSAQDLGDVEEYNTLADGLAGALESFGGPERDDLLMRFHGTEAQAHAIGSVYGVDGFSSAEAVGHVEKALEYAYAIAGAASADSRDKAESDVAQDLNYRHLMLALFSPGSAAEAEAFACAQRQLKELSPGSALNNRYHQMRQKSLAYFNAWRNGADVPGAAERAFVRLPSGDAEGWLVAANRRHLGALAAAAGDADEAAKCFAEGDLALPLGKCWAPVLGSIRFALLVQASCSLAACGMREESARYAGLAEEAYSQFGQSKLFGVIHAEKWMEALRASSDPRTLPAFYY